MDMRRILICAVLASLGLAQAARGQDYPSKPIRVIVPYSAGGGTDIFARIIAKKLGERLDVQMIVENRAGAGGIVGSEVVAQAPPDGYTLLMMANTHALYPSFYKNVPFDPVQSFTPVSLVASGANVLVVHTAFPDSQAGHLLALAGRRK